MFNHLLTLAVCFFLIALSALVGFALPPLMVATVFFLTTLVWVVEGYNAIFVMIETLRGKA